VSAAASTAAAAQVEDLQSPQCDGEQKAVLTERSQSRSGGWSRVVCVL